MAAAPLGLSVFSSLLGFATEREASKIERGESEIAAQQEELAVKQREADRKDRLASALAVQNAQAGASGVAAFEGSPLTVLQDSIEREKTATQRDTFSSSLRAQSLRSRGKVRSRMGRITSGLKLLDSLSEAAQASPLQGK